MWTTVGLALLLQVAAGEPVVARRAVHILCQRLPQSDDLNKNELCGLLTRTKRSSGSPWSHLLSGFTLRMPDTKWCGTGNNATHYADLGSAEATDRCCRDHDYCPLTLTSGQSRGGATNSGPFTQSSCECDADFFDCLVDVNTLHSQLVGEIYFNLLQPKCVKNKTIDSRTGREGDPDEEQLELVNGPMSDQFPDLLSSGEDMPDDADDVTIRALYTLLKNGQRDQ